MTVHVSLSKQIWCKIRYFQLLKDIPKEKLAQELNVHPRTLANYENKPENITLSQIDSFLTANDLKLEDLI